MVQMSACIQSCVGGCQTISLQGMFRGFRPRIFRITCDLHFKTNLPILFHKLKITKYEAYKCMCNTYLFIVTI